MESGYFWALVCKKDNLIGTNYLPFGTMFINTVNVFTTRKDARKAKSALVNPKEAKVTKIFIGELKGFSC
jgi:hypothetical protein